MTKKNSLLSNRFNFEKGKLSASDLSQIVQIIEIIESNPPSEISDNKIKTMEQELHRIYFSANKSIGDHPVVGWIGAALDSMASAASIVKENPKIRPREVSENLRNAARALNTALVANRAG